MNLNIDLQLSYLINHNLFTHTCGITYKVSIKKFLPGSILLKYTFSLIFTYNIAYMKVFSGPYNIKKKKCVAHCNTLQRKRRFLLEGICCVLLACSLFSCLGLLLRIIGFCFVVYFTFNRNSVTPIDLV